MLEEILYSVRLEREVREIKEKYPEIEKIINSVRKWDHTSNIEFDHNIERDWHIYKELKTILSNIKK